MVFKLLEYVTLNSIEFRLHVPVLLLDVVDEGQVVPNIMVLCDVLFIIYVLPYNLETITINLRYEPTLFLLISQVKHLLTIYSYFSAWFSLNSRKSHVEQYELPPKASIRIPKITFIMIVCMIKNQDRS